MGRPKGSKNKIDKRIIKICHSCGNKFKVCIVRKNKALFCSHKCYWYSLKGKVSWCKGKHLSEEHKNKLKIARKRYVFTTEIRNKLSLSRKKRDWSKVVFKKGENHHNWLGDKATYGSIHDWVSRWLGYPNKCEHCGKTINNHLKIDWANKDHLYRRNFKDWIRLCKSCHRAYDFKNNLPHPEFIN